jgi:hypothetical protein
MASWTLAKGAITLRDQVNKRWPERDKKSDGSIGDSKHQQRQSDHNPDKNGIVHAIDIDEDFNGSKNDNKWFSDQLLAYARKRIKGYNRLKNIVYEDRVASGTYSNQFWVWRDGHYGHEIHMHVSFTTNADNDATPFDVPILFSKGKQWDGVVPFYDNVEKAMAKKEKTKDTWRIACRLSELGFYEGKVLPEGQQSLPIKALTNMQDFMGWEKEPYNPRVHKRLWREIRFSTPEG